MQSFRYDKCKAPKSVRKGAMLVLLVIITPILIILAGFAINLSAMEMYRTELQVASDAASRTACRTFSKTGDRGAALAAARRTLEANLVGGKKVTIDEDDLIFGNSIRDETGDPYDFDPGREPINSVRVNLKTKPNALPMPIAFQFFSDVDFVPSQTATATQAELDIVLIVDRSGSMAFNPFETADRFRMPALAPRGWDFGDPAPPRSRWLDVVASTDAFLSVLRSTSGSAMVGLVSYNSEAESDVNLTDDDAEIGDALDKYTRKFEAGGTNIGDSIEAALDMFDDSDNSRPFAVRAIVLMTDGIHNEGLDPIKAAQDAADSDVIIYTVTFSREADQATMKRVAQIGLGKHIHATDGESLTKAFQDIARDLPVLITD